MIRHFILNSVRKVKLTMRQAGFLRNGEATGCSSGLLQFKQCIVNPVTPEFSQSLCSLPVRMKIEGSCVT